MKKKNLIISLISGGGLVGTGATTAGVLVTNQDKLSKADDQVIVPLSPSAPSTDGTETKTTDSNLPKPTPIQTQNLNLIDYQRIQDMVVAREEAEKNDLHQKALALIASAEENQAKAYNLAIAQSLANANREKNLDAIKAAALSHTIDAWSKAKLAKAQEFQTKRADAAIVAHNEAAAAKAEQFVSSEENQAAAFIAAYNASVKDAKLDTLKTSALNHAIDAWSKAKLAKAQEFQTKRADAAIVAHNEAAAKAEQFVSNEENQAAAFIAAYNASVKDAKLDTIKTSALNHAIDAWSKAKLAKAQEFQTKRADAAIVAHNEAAAAKAEQFVSSEENQAAAFIAAYNASVKDAKLDTLKTSALNHAIDAWSKAKLAKAQEFQTKRADAAIVAHNEAAAAKAEQFVSSEENQAAAFIAAYNASVKDAKLDTLKTSALNHAIDAWSKAKLAKAQEFQTKRADAAIVAHNEAAAKAEQFVSSNEENQAAAFIAAYNASVKDAKLDTLKTSALNHAIDAWSKAKLAKAQEFQTKRADAAIVAHNEAAAKAEQFVSSEENQAAAFIAAYNASVKDAKLDTLKTSALNHAIDAWSKAKLAKAQEFQTKRADAAIVAHNEAAEAKELDNSQEIGAHITRDAASFISAYNKSVEAAKEYTQWMAMQNSTTAQYNQNVFAAKASALADAAIVAHNEAAEAKELDNSQEIGAHITRDAASFINAYNKSVEAAKEYTQWMAMQNNKTAQYNQNVFAAKASALADAEASALADAAIVAHNEAAEAKELDNSQEIGAHITRDAASFISAYNKSVEAAKEYTQWMAMQNNKTAQYNQNVFDAKASALADAAIVAHNEAAEAKELDNSWEIGARDQKIVAAETVARDLAVSQHKNLILLEAQKISQQNKIVSEQVTAANNGLDNAIVTLDVPGAIWQLNKTVVTSIPYANGEIEATTIYDGFESKTTIKVFEGAGSARHEITDEDKQLTLRIAERINQEITIHSRDARQSYISTHQGNITELEKTRVAYMEHARADAIKANTFTPINPNWTVVFSSKQSDGGPQLSSALNDLVSYNPKNASEAQQWITTMTKMASDDHTVVTVTSGSNFDLIFKNNNKHGSSITDPNSFNNLWTRLQDQNIRSQIRNFMQQNKEHDFTENVLALAIYLNPNQLSHSAISQNVKIQLTDAIAKVNTVKQVATSTATTRRSTSIRSAFVLTNENKAIAEKAISYLNDYSSWSASTIFAALKADLKNALAKWLTYSPSQADKLQINNWITKINNINAH